MGYNDDDIYHRTKAKVIPIVPVVDPAAEKKALMSRLMGWVPGLSNAAASQFATYHSELLRFNKAVNLVSPTTTLTADSVHFADSALASKLLYKSLLPGSPLYDIGSGNGFPGLVFSVMYPDFRVILVDRDKRKIEFLKHIISTLGLKNTTTEGIGVENLKPGSVKNAVSRGFAPLHRALLICRKQVCAGGRYFHLKGDGWANEIAQVPSQLFSYWTPSLAGQYRLPNSNNDMAVVVTEKTAE